MKYLIILLNKSLNNKNFMQQIAKKLRLCIPKARRNFLPYGFEEVSPNIFAPFNREYEPLDGKEKKLLNETRFIPFLKNIRLSDEQVEEINSTEPTYPTDSSTIKSLSLLKFKDFSTDPTKVIRKFFLYNDGLTPHVKGKKDLTDLYYTKLSKLYNAGDFYTYDRHVVAYLSTDTEFFNN
jgi:hypothetical protein